MYELILRYRLGVYPGAGRDFALPQSSVADVKRLLKFYPDYYEFSPDEYGGFSYGCSLRLKSGVVRPSLEQMAEILRSDAEQAGRKAAGSDYELLAAVLSRGEIQSYYGHTFWGQDHETFHLLMCGINWDRFGVVHDTRWSQFDGTFAESDREKSVLEAATVCNCSDEVEVHFGLEPPSLASLYAALSAGVLERLFEV